MPAILVAKTAPKDSLVVSGARVLDPGEGLDVRVDVRVDDGVIAALEEFLPAAPAHNAIYLDGIRAFRESMPETPLVAAFETEFHRTMPDYARQYGVRSAVRARSSAGVP